MDSLDRAAQLHFFRTTPAEFMTRASVASSLQSFETCLFLIALERYPHAFVSCVFSIESVLKGALPQHARKSLKELIRVARSPITALQAFDEADLDALRTERNHIVHEGFSPKDDRVATNFFLRTGLPFLTECYKQFFNFSIFDGLEKNFSRHILIAREAFGGLPSEGNPDFTLCLRALGHLVRWSLRESFMSQAELKASEEADVYGLTFDVVNKRREKAERMFEPSWAFDCPVCRGGESFVAQLDEYELRRKRISLSKGICVECELTIPKACPTLANALCRDQIENISNDILREYGIDPDLRQ